LRRAASEIHDGKFTAKELVRLVDKVPLIGKALHLILTYQPDESASEED
jgi:hypothetical protein